MHTILSRTLRADRKTRQFAAFNPHSPVENRRSLVAGAAAKSQFQNAHRGSCSEKVVRGRIGRGEPESREAPWLRCRLFKARRTNVALCASRVQTPVRPLDLRLCRPGAGEKPLSQSETIHLAADLSFLHTDYLWRMPGSWIGYPYYGTSEFYEDIARIAARGIMDMLFFGDTGGTSEDYGGNHEAVVRYGAKWPRHDMTPMIPLMAKAAPGVGFALTLSTTYHHPFHCARAVQRARSRDPRPHRLECGDLGLQERSGELRLRCHDGSRRALRARRRNSSTSPASCGTASSRMPSCSIAKSGIYADPKKVHRIDHRGRYFNVRGPLPALPSPQRRPVIIQAGLSGPGMNLAATYAELQFSTRRTLPSMQQHRQALDEARRRRTQTARRRHPLVDPRPGGGVRR